MLGEDKKMIQETFYVKILKSDSQDLVKQTVRNSWWFQIEKPFSPHGLYRNVSAL